MHEWLRREGLHALDRQQEIQARIIIGSPKPVLWHEIEFRLQDDGSGTVLFAWMKTPGATYWSRGWPDKLDPMDVYPAIQLPDDWEDLRVGPGLQPREREARGGRRPPGRPPTELPAPGERPDYPDITRIPARQIQSVDPGRRYAAFTDGETTLLLGISRTPVTENLARFRRDLLAVAPIALLLAFVSGFLVAGRSMGSINRLTTAMEQIKAEDLAQRVDPAEADREFASLVGVYNAMLGRLQTSFDDTRRFADNAAHELRTPLTILQGKLEEAIRSEESGSDRQAFFAALLEEVARLKGITDQLLLLARRDAGRLDLYIEDVNLSELLDALLEDAMLLAPQLQFDNTIPPGVHHPCDRALVTQVLHNLLSNATKYNVKENGYVRVALVTRDDYLYIRVTNSARPIPKEQREKIFERFHRLDQSRSRRVEGTGLGLNLAREIANSHGGALILERSDEAGTVFLLTLPRKNGVQGQRTGAIVGTSGEGIAASK